MEKIKEKTHVENSVKVESDDEHGYNSLDKETLIKLLIERDKIIWQKTEIITSLEQDVQLLSDHKTNLRTEFDKLKSELLLLKKNLEPAPIQQKEITENVEYSEKPMPDWSDSTVDDIASSISDVVRATAEAELKNMEVELDANGKGDEDSMCDPDKETNSEYVYDSSSGYYYHPSTGYYWDPNYELFYDYTSGTYFRYNETSGEYELHSHVDTHPSSISSDATKKEENLSSTQQDKHAALKRKGLSQKKLKQKTRRKYKKSSKMKTQKEDSGNDYVDLGEGHERKAAIDEPMSNSEDESSGSLATDESELLSDLESGEIVSSSSSDVEILGEEMSCERTTKFDDFDSMDQHYIDALAENYPPCIRVIVKESERLGAGTLFIVTCTGGTIGRDTTAKHIIQIPDIGVSKNHASIEYDYEESCYKVIDLGSQNGTRVNGDRLYKSKSQSDSHTISHGDILQFGSTTKLLLHIHKGHETCEDCEPGQIQAKLKAANLVKNNYVVLTSEEKKQQRKKELKNIKKKYGLQNSYFENEGAVPRDPEYTDKAYLRRTYVGSEIENSRTDSPASVHCPIASSNKGHKLLAKMGWKEGQGLGKANAGMSEPINVELRINQNAGLGSVEGHSLSLDRVQDSGKAKRWSQARKRFNQLPPTNDPSSKDCGAQSVPPDVGANVHNTRTDISSNKNVPLTPSTSKLKINTSKPKISWHKGETEVLSTKMSDNKDS